MPAPNRGRAGIESLWLVRHGESAGNVARDRAEQQGLHTIELVGRDIDVPLSPLGERQSRALGRWLNALDPEQKPTVVLTSPYVRARRTAELLIDEGHLHHPQLVFVSDERLREKEFGSLNRFTKLGITTRFPHEAALRAEIGKFYYRPPGGESWCDVLLRLRSLMDHIELRYAGERVLIVAHQVTVLCFRFLLEELDEQRILAIDREKDVANCSVTRFEKGVGPGVRESLRLEAYNFVAPLEAAGEPITRQPDAPGAAKA
ncbi:MAG TPA: histidine phosphatase family protein [Polyangiaceae bacterium]|nr:histidine phosphatase family protein [Polyangiaceae bacterium]